MKPARKRAVLTGAFSYTGAAVARELLRRRYHVHTLTHRNPPSILDENITISPLKFDFDFLVSEMEKADVFINTYWIRLPYGGQTFGSAVENSVQLFDAAKKAGVRRIVHVSVSNASEGKNLGYYAGKAKVESYLRKSGLSFAIVKPTLIVGPSDVLTNNIAWFLRRLPVFALPEGGNYRIQPVTLGDAARIICDTLTETKNVEIDAAGPEVFTFGEYVRLVAKACRVRRWFVSLPKGLVLSLLWPIEKLVGDVVLTREEISGLEQELLVSKQRPLGEESVRAWLLEYGPHLGRQYTNDLDRHFRAGKEDPILGYQEG